MTHPDWQEIDQRTFFDNSHLERDLTDATMGTIREDRIFFAIAIALNAVLFGLVIWICRLWGRF